MRALLYLSIIFAVIVAALTFEYQIEPEQYDDTISYEPVQENIYIEPESVPEETVELPSLPPKEDIPAPTPPPGPQAEEQPVVQKALPAENTAPEADEVQNVHSWSDINTVARNALVNILCLTDGPHKYISPISGSGTFIDERGIVLTNAHIGQFFLFKDYPTKGFVDCLIRTGSPAQAAYHAQLLYISPAWVRDNARAITEENPTGTGEDDYALLLVTGAVNGVTVPDTFPFIRPNVTENSIEKDEEFLVGGYPAGFLGGRTVQQDLYSATAVTSAKELYTFETGTLDIVSLGGSVVAQQGSSGGPLVDATGAMVGLISTASDGETTDDRDLRAITLEHIERSLIANNNTTLTQLLSGDIEAKSAAFEETAAPTLLQLLVNGF